MKTINVELNVDNKDAVKSVNDLEQELEQLREEFSKVEIGSKEFNRLGNEIKKTEGRIKDIELQFESLDKEQRIVAVTDSFAGLAGTVEIAVGAFAALGIESEELENVERRVIGLIGVVQGFQAVGEGIIAFNKLVGPGLKAAFTTATGAVNGFRVALASLGIGVVVGAVTLLIENFDKLKEAFFGAADAAKLTGDELKKASESAGQNIAKVEILTAKINDQTLAEEDRKLALQELQDTYPNYFENLKGDINNTDALKLAKDKLIDTLIREGKIRALQSKIEAEATEFAEKRIEALQEVRDQEEAQLDRQEKLAKARAGEFIAFGLTQEQTISGLQKDIQAGLTFITNAQARAGEKIKQINKEEEEAIKLLTNAINLETKAVEKNGGATEVYTPKIEKKVEKKKEAKKVTEENVKAIEAEGKALGQTTSAEEQYTANFVNLSNIRIEATQMEESVRQAIREQRRKERQEEFKEDAEAFQGQVDAYADYANRVASNIREFQEQNTEVQQNLLKNQFDQGLITEEQYLKQSEELQKKAFEQNKNVSIAQAIISTIQGGVDAFTSTLKIDPTGITGTILAGLALAAGYAQVDAIRSTTYESPNEGPSSIGGGGTARVGVPLSTGGGAPGGLFSDRITLGQDSATAGAGGTTKMYVLAGDVTSAQAANAKIKQRRKL